MNLFQQTRLSLILAFVASCNSERPSSELPNTTPAVLVYSASFDFFSGLFNQTELPYTFDSKKDNPELNWLPISLIDKWILDTDQDSSDS